MYTRTGRTVQVVIMGATALSVLALAAPASAHRDGCHRWHSCPSDTGSYVCGDLGYTSECPGGSDDLPETDPVEYDFTAPAESVLGDATAKAGMVTVPVTAERGSKIRVVNESDKVLATARATGSRQKLTFRVQDGTQTLYVHATDAEGNESDLASLDLDLSAPAAPQLEITPPTGNAGQPAIRLSGESGATYVVTVLDESGKSVAKLGRKGALAADDEVNLPLLAPEGKYIVRAVVTDSAGNVSSATSKDVTVATARPALTITRDSDPDDGRMRLSLSGPAAGSGRLALTAAGSPPAVDLPFNLDGFGKASVAEDIGDGTWVAKATVKDFLDRSADAELSGLLIDTVAPALDVLVDQQAADDGRLTASFAVEDGAEVVVSGLPGGDQTFTQAGPARLEAAAVEAGVHHLRVRAVDAAGNETVRELDVELASQTSPADAAAGFAMLAGLGAATYYGIRRRRRRRAIAHP